MSYSSSLLTRPKAETTRKLDAGNESMTNLYSFSEESVGYPRDIFEPITYSAISCTACIAGPCQRKCGDYQLSASSNSAVPDRALA